MVSASRAALRARARQYAARSALSDREREVRQRDQLLALFWPERDTNQARAALNRAIYHLRQFLGDGIVLSRGDEEIGIARERLWCDATAFDDAIASGDYRTAVDLYRTMDMTFWLPEAETALAQVLA